MLRLTIFLAFLAFAVAEQANTESCETGQDTRENSHISFKSMTVSECANPEKCTLIRNTTHSITITFVSLEDQPTVRMFVYGRVLRVRVPYIRGVDVCNTTNASDGSKCTEDHGLKKDKTYSLEYPFYIRSQFPEWSVPVEFEIHNDSVKIACVRMLVEIKCNLLTEASCQRKDNS